MTYSKAQLSAYYQALTGLGPDSTAAASLAAAAQQDAAGQISDSRALDAALNAPGVQSTFDVAEASYQFFTGASTSAAGLAYLRGDAGGGNARGLNTAYYSGFNLENRYYNFAVNLASAGGAGNAAFISHYGALTLAQTIDSAYEAIVGTTSVGAEGAAAAKADIATRLPYFTEVANERAGGVDTGGAAGQNVALKAILIGYILEEGVKADVGTYARALDEFEASAATGNALFGSNLLTTYAPGGAGYGKGIGGPRTGDGVTYYLTAGPDVFDTPGGNATFIANVVGYEGERASPRWTPPTWSMRGVAATRSW